LKSHWKLIFSFLLRSSNWWTRLTRNKIWYGLIMHMTVLTHFYMKHYILKNDFTCHFSRSWYSKQRIRTEHSTRSACSHYCGLIESNIANYNLLMYFYAIKCYKHTNVKYSTLRWHFIWGKSPFFLVVFIKWGFME